MLLVRMTAGALLATGLLAQSEPTLKFEVAAIHPAPDPLTLSPVERRQQPSGVKVNGNRVEIGDLSLQALIMTAFGVGADRITGPDWMSKEWSNIQATMPAGATKDQLPELLQSLLIERFHLTLHRVSKEQSGCGLALGKGPPKLEPALPDVDYSDDLKQPRPRAASPGAPKTSMVYVPGDSAYGQMRAVISAGRAHEEFASITLRGFTDYLTKVLQHPVVDRTGLKGEFYLTLDFTLPNSSSRPPGDVVTSQAEAASEPPGGDSIFTAIEKLGLKLEAEKVMIEQLVIDQLEKAPIEN